MHMIDLSAVFFVQSKVLESRGLILIGKGKGLCCENTCILFSLKRLHPDLFDIFNNVFYVRYV